MLLAPEGTTPPERVQEAVDRIFAAPEFQKGLGLSSEGQSLGEYVMGKLVEWYLKLLLFLQELRGGSPVLFWIVIGLLVVILLLLLYHLYWTFSLAFRGHGGPAGADEPAFEAARVARFRELRAEARRYAETGEFRESIRTLFFALLALLDERRVLSVARGWTNREILNRIRLPEPSRTSFHGLAIAAEAASYGKSRVDEAEYRRIEEAFEMLVRSLPKAGRDAASTQENP